MQPSGSRQPAPGDAGDPGVAGGPGDADDPGGARDPGAPSTPGDPSAALTAVGLFAGIGGLEAGFAQAGIRTELACEIAEPARRVLAAHWPGLPLVGDIAELEALPQADVVTAGFPCQDLSQAGRTAGITGERSGLVGHVFRLLDRARRRPPRWLVLENVRNMLPLDRGRAMRYLVGELEQRGYRWAYRVVDARCTGVPQRRQRVLLVASRTEDPAAVLFADDAGPPEEAEHYAEDAYGFYWTEGVRGLGWARDAVPTLKGGSGFGIPSPPAIWLPGSPLERRFVTPGIAATEILQGFWPDWTAPAEATGGRSPRWTLVGNAVTVPLARWLASRLVEPGAYDPGGSAGDPGGSAGDPSRAGAVRERPLGTSGPWPPAARGEPGGGPVGTSGRAGPRRSGRRYRVEVSMWPERAPYRHLTDALPAELTRPLSHRAAAGFLNRTERARLRFVPAFLRDVRAYVRHTATGTPVPESGPEATEPAVGWVS